MSVRACYRVEIELRSSLSIGAADNNVADCDVLLDSRGEPLIPGASLAGVFRSLFYDSHAEETLRDKESTRIFGKLDKEEKSESAIRIHDAQLVSKLVIQDDNGNEGDVGSRTTTRGNALYNTEVSVRDGVKLLDGEKVAEPKKKFDRQIVEAGAVFLAFIEILDETRCLETDVHKMLIALHSGELCLGSRTSRGFGRVRIIQCLVRRFDLSDPKGIDDWVNFDMYDENDKCWSDEEVVDLMPTLDDFDSNKLFCQKDEVALRLKLNLRGGIDVREYETQVETHNYRQLIIHGINRNGEDVPVVPGTSWAGAIRSRYSDLRRWLGGNTEALFGIVNEESGEVRRSAIVFSESQVEGGEWKTITRNAIDPLTGGTIDEALYTERVYWGGTTILEIRIRQLDALPEGSRCLMPLVAALADLHNGFLAVGGLTAVGRGLFRIEEGNETRAYSRGEDVTNAFFSAMNLGEFAKPDIQHAATTLFGKEPEEEASDD